MVCKFIFSIVFCFLTSVALPRFAAALESIVIAYPTTSSQFTPLWFARDVGLYEKYGLDGKLVFIQGGSILLQAMLAGPGPCRAKRHCRNDGSGSSRRRCKNSRRHVEHFSLYAYRRERR